MDNSNSKDKNYLDYIIYHRFIALKREFSKSKDGKEEQVVYVSPKRAFEKDIYHFHSYKDKTFSTFFTGLKFWDTQADYYKQGRKAVKKLKEFVRVFLVEDIADLERPILTEQIKLDFEAGIKIYLCLFDKVKDYLPEPDFGTWDDKYLCIVPFGKDKKVKNIIMSNKQKDLDRARGWVKILKKNSAKINQPEEDVRKFTEKYKKG